MFGFTFHYFENEVHIPCQGSLTADQFRRLLDALQQEYRIITPQAFLGHLKNGTGEEEDICLCFDCGLKSQYDVALPILEERGLRAFWFLYTSVFQGKIVPIEQYHHFRFSCFPAVLDFYRAFFTVLKQREPDKFAQGMEDFHRSSYLSWAVFYTEEDRQFKFFRDRVLQTWEYDALLTEMMAQAGYNVEYHRHNLWLTAAEVRQLSDNGHIIGMHTHSHPNEIAALSYEEQQIEYETNQRILQAICDKPVTCMSHPCNSYNADTLRILEALGVEAGFRADSNAAYSSRLEIPRIDHSQWIHAHKELKIWQ